MLFTFMKPRNSPTIWTIIWKKLFFVPKNKMIPKLVDFMNKFGIIEINWILKLLYAMRLSSWYFTSTYGFSVFPFLYLSFHLMEFKNTNWHKPWKSITVDEEYIKTEPGRKGLSTSFSVINMIAENGWSYWGQL